MVVAVQRGRSWRPTETRTRADARFVGSSRARGAVVFKYRFVLFLEVGVLHRCWHHFPNVNARRKLSLLKFNVRPPQETIRTNAATTILNSSPLPSLSRFRCVQARPAVVRRRSARNRLYFLGQVKNRDEERGRGWRGRSSPIP